MFYAKAFGADVQYNMRIDGITCPFCVKTSAKALKKFKGVKAVSADLKQGIIKVCADKKTTFTDKALIELFKKKGFTYRNMSKQDKCDPA